MDNTTPYKANEFDLKVEKTIPFYSEFYNQAIDLLKSFGFKNANWLDTGCGTGAFIAKVITSDAFKGFRFTLCDPSEEMLGMAREKVMLGGQITDFCACGSQELDYKEAFHIVTAIQSHHYMDYDDRVIAVKKCYDALYESGVFVFFENFAPCCERSKEIALDRWMQYQIKNGKTKEEAKTHKARYGKNYFPITISEHFKILKNCGFQTVDIFWLSYMQVGIYAIK